MQAFQRIVRDVLLATAVGATAAVPAGNLMGQASFEQIAGASLEEFMPWGAFGGGVLDDLGDAVFGDEPLPDPSVGAPAAGERDDGPQVQLLSEITAPDPTSCALLLGGLLGWAWLRRRIERRRHAGGIGAYLA